MTTMIIYQIIKPLVYYYIILAYIIFILMSDLKDLFVYKAVYNIDILYLPLDLRHSRI